MLPVVVQSLNIDPDPLVSSIKVFFLHFRIDTDAASRLNEDLNLEVLNGLDWEGNPTLATSLQDSLVRNPVLGFCRAGSSEVKVILNGE